MINIAICDNNATLTGELEKMLTDTAIDENIDISCDVFLDGSTLVKAITEQKLYFELIFLDIEMNTMNGIQAAQILRDMDVFSLIVYISSHEKYMKDLFYTEPFRFLAKPINQTELHDAFLSAYKRIRQKTEYYTFAYNKSLLKIPLKQIAYFESNNRVILIHLVNANSPISNNNPSDTFTDRFYGKMNDVEKEIESTGYRFLRIHQSYLVNFDYIKNITFTSAFMIDGTELHISEDRQKQIRTLFCEILASRE